MVLPPRQTGNCHLNSEKRELSMDELPIDDELAIDKLDSVGGERF
jgi:hypothetical protein